MKDKYFKFLIVGIILILSVFLDQWSKFWAEDNLASPHIPDHVVTLNVPDSTAEPMSFEAFIQARYPKNSEDTNKHIVANAMRDNKRLMPQDEVKPGDKIDLRYVSLTVIDGYYDYQYARNPGAAFSFLAKQSDQFRSIFFGITGILAIIFILVFIGHSSWKKQKPLIIALACVLGGAAGNIIDRARLSYVIDFISWHIGDKYYWPTFNIADVFVTCGVVFLILDLLIHKEKKAVTEGKGEKENTAADVQCKLQGKYQKVLVADADTADKTESKPSDDTADKAESKPSEDTADKAESKPSDDTADKAESKPSEDKADAGKSDAGK
ncbi:MAG: signal peptidase II [Proteobacteria bacterium]|nr:signal peptidase II [Pseudomonadota bacterium]